jgi:hypothetical protein
MAKRKAIKRGKKTARKKSAGPDPCLEARPMHEDEMKGSLVNLLAHEDEMEGLLLNLLARAGADADAGPERIGALLARQGLERVSFAMLSEAMQWAREDGESERSAWAGQFLASMLTVLAKRSDWLAAKSQAFAKRKASLASLADLQAKPGGPSPYMTHLLRAYDRALLAGIIDLEEIGGSEDFARLFPWLSALEGKIPSLLAEGEANPEGRAKSLFEEIIWPILQADEATITSDPAVKDEMNKRMTDTQRKPSFRNLKNGFSKAWGTLYARPEGNLRGIERTPI